MKNIYRKLRFDLQKNYVFVHMCNYFRPYCHPKRSPETKSEKLLFLICQLLKEHDPIVTFKSDLS